MRYVSVWRQGRQEAETGRKQEWRNHRVRTSGDALRNVLHNSQCLHRFQPRDNSFGVLILHNAPPKLDLPFNLLYTRPRLVCREGSTPDVRGNYGNSMGFSPCVGVHPLEDIPHGGIPFALPVIVPDGTFIWNIPTTASPRSAPTPHTELSTISLVLQ